VSRTLAFDGASPGSPLFFLALEHERSEHDLALAQGSADERQQQASQ
jgi:hypothetical protein